MGTKLRSIVGEREMYNDSKISKANQIKQMFDIDLTGRLDQSIEQSSNRNRAGTVMNSPKKHAMFASGTASVAVIPDRML